MAYIRFFSDSSFGNIGILESFIYTYVVTSPLNSDPCDESTCIAGTSYCRQLCAPVGATCECEDPQMYGEDCSNRDGVWGPWGAWSRCFPTCRMVRTRDCDSPAPAGDSGLGCVGNDTEEDIGGCDGDQLCPGERYTQKWSQC